ncbi:hypothetical protein MRB53_035397 [Persea americana]|uniref:Uncharacterized protein n=1 Tax=Persea americana TaxID=3435 RepID=A0ACC2K4K4_PERAE|nr:hypothetical protein MRB53_035397 [Persea americana]
MDASRNVVEDQLVVKVRAFVERVIASFGTIDENTGSTILYKAIRLVHSKLTKFHASCATGLDKLDIEECLKDETNEAQQGQHTCGPTMAPTSSPPITGPSSYVDPLLEFSPTQLHVQTLTSVEKVVQSSASQVQVQTPTSAEPLFQSSPSQVHVQTPISVENVFQSSPRHSMQFQTPASVSNPTPMPEKHVVSSIKKRDINSIVARVKGLGRKNKAIPTRFDPYQLTRKKGKLEPNPDYALTDRDRAIMNLFWDHYTANAEHLYYTAFGVEAFLGRRFSQLCTLIFPIVRNQHFFLIIGYVDRGRFEYYNSIMGRDGNRQFAEEFVVFLKSCFMGLGWDGPLSWPLEDAENCPQQEIINDCGIFVMAYAEHAAYRRKVAFTQADIWYYRQRIVIDVYTRQWEMVDVV